MPGRDGRGYDIVRATSLRGLALRQRAQRPRARAYIGRGSSRPAPSRRSCSDSGHGMSAACLIKDGMFSLRSSCAPGVFALGRPEPTSHHAAVRWPHQDRVFVLPGVIAARSARQVVMQPARAGCAGGPRRRAAGASIAPVEKPATSVREQRDRLKRPPQRRRRRRDDPGRAPNRRRGSTGPSVYVASRLVAAACVAAQVGVRLVGRPSVPHQRARGAEAPWSTRVPLTSLGSGLVAARQVWRATTAPVVALRTWAWIPPLLSVAVLSR